MRRVNPAREASVLNRGEDLAEEPRTGPGQVPVDAATEYAKKLRDLLQLDIGDLDFGIYRIINQRRAEIVRFLEQDLPARVEAAFEQYKSADKIALEKQLHVAIKQAQDLQIDPESSPKVKELRGQLSEAVDISMMIDEIFSAVYTFFSRYYIEGDFISQRR